MRSPFVAACVAFMAAILFAEDSVQCRVSITSQPEGASVSVDITKAVWLDE